MLAIDWEPEIRGLLTVIIGGGRAVRQHLLDHGDQHGGAPRRSWWRSPRLFGWLMLMGVTWWIYGIGLKGPDPTWARGAGQDGDAGHAARCTGRASST